MSDWLAETAAVITEHFPNLAAFLVAAFALIWAAAVYLGAADAKKQADIEFAEFMEQLKTDNAEDGDPMVHSQ